MGSVRSRILGIFILNILIIIALVLTFTLNQTYEHAYNQIKINFQISQEVLRYKLENDAKFLKRSLETFAKDFNTKQLISEGEQDPDSLTSALTNHKNRVNAQFVVATLKNGKVIANTSSFDIPLNPKNYNQPGLHFVVEKNNAYLVQSSIVKFLENSPTADAWITMGIKINDLITLQLKQLVDAEISIIMNRKILASTSKEKNYKPEEKILSESKKGLSKIHSNQKDWIIFRFDLSKNEALDGVFYIDSNSAFIDYMKLAFDLSLIISIAVAISLFITLRLTKTIVEPLIKLARIAESIKQGIYDNEIPRGSEAEIQKLSSALESMQTSIKNRESEINALAFYDTLTDLPNRNFFLRKLEEFVRESKNLLLILIDLDRFKDINDTLGHNMGDELIILIAQRMQSFHFGNAFHAHLSGDEFGVIISDIECFDESSLVTQYENLFKIPFLIKGIHLDVDASFGVAKFPEHANTVSSIMQCADIALYKCKNSHLKTIIYHPDLNTHSVQRLQLMSELRKAIESDQLTLYYQPKISLTTMEFISVECLVRWIHPEHGLVSPDQFIPLAEQSGVIRNLTQWAIKTALLQQKRWQEQGLDINVAVNISAIDLIDLSLPPYVCELLSSLSASPKKLTLEVTESAIMADPEASYQALKMLRHMGIKLSIDDFGTGYSSLGQLKKLPVDELKIDQSFVRNLNDDKEDRIIIKSAADLSHNLSLSVVAEGVENEQSLWILKSLNIDIVQGYLIAKPMPSEQLWEWYLTLKRSGGQYAPESFSA